MNEKPKRKRSAGKIYRPPLLLRILVGLIYLPAIFLFSLIFPSSSLSQLIHPSSYQLCIPLLWCIIILYWIIYGWQYLVTSFRVSPVGGEFRGGGYRITFTWEQVQGIKWVQKRNRRVLCLLLRETETVSKNILVRDSRISEYQLPLEPFTPIGNSQFFEKAFMDTPLGQELLTYVPHIYEPYLVEDKQKSKR